MVAAKVDSFDWCPPESVRQVACSLAYVRPLHFGHPPPSNFRSPIPASLSESINHQPRRMSWGHPPQRIILLRLHGCCRISPLESAEMCTPFEDRNTVPSPYSCTRNVLSDFGVLSTGQSFRGSLYRSRSHSSNNAVCTKCILFSRAWSSWGLGLWPFVLFVHILMPAKSLMRLVKHRPMLLSCCSNYAHNFFIL